MASLEDGSHDPYGLEQETQSILAAGFTFDQICRTNKWGKAVPGMAQRVSWKLREEITST